MSDKSALALTLFIKAREHDSILREKLPYLKLVHLTTKKHLGRRVNDELVIADIKTAVATDYLINLAVLFKVCNSF